MGNIEGEGNMSLENLKIIFELDGEGIVMYPNYPIHVDSLIAVVLAEEAKLDPVTRDGRPIDIDLPLKKWTIDDNWGWCASVLFIEGASFEAVGYWRKRFRQERFSGIGSQKVNLIQGIFRDYNTPLPVIVCRFLVAYVVGDAERVFKILRKIRYIGHKRNIGYGRVIGLSIEDMDEDYSIEREGRTQRFLPDRNGIKFVRTRPPYWNNFDRVKCVGVGDKV
jgi:CRISPR type IV-associated protein Csf3